MNWVIPVVVLLFMGILGVVLVMAVPYIRGNWNRILEELQKVMGVESPRMQIKLTKLKMEKRLKAQGKTKEG